MSTIKPSDQRDSGGIFGKISFQIKLVSRLIKDQRISLFLKFIPFASLLYLIMPIDILPDPIPLDDLAVIWIACYFFIEACPQEIVEEHRQNIIGMITGTWYDPPQDTETSDETSPITQLPETASSLEEKVSKNSEKETTAYTPK